MKLALSNLALPDHVRDADWASLRDAGVQGIEVAPTRIAAWDALTADRIENYRHQLDGNGLAVSSLQAIFFGVPDISLLVSRSSFEKMDAHINRVGEIGALLNARVAVLGAPKQRNRGDMTAEKAFELGAQRLERLAKTMSLHGMIIGLEPVPAAYNGDFLPKWKDVFSMVQHVGHSSLRVHLDTGCVLLGDDAIDEAILATHDVLAHFHIAEPGLAGFDAPVAHHAAAAAKLTKVNYQGWLAIEMMEQKQGPMDAIKTAVAFVRNQYPVSSHKV